MAPHETSNAGCGRSLLVMLLIIGAIALCSGVMGFALDSACYAGQSPLLPTYPGATVVDTTTNAPRPFGWGETIIVLETEDDPSTVSAWYSGQYGRALGARARGPLSFLGGISDASYSVQPAEGGGSRVILRARCGS